MADDAGRVPVAPGASSLRSPEPVPVSAHAGDAPSRWSINYIDDAATRRVTIRRPNGSIFTDKASNYDPPDNGIHLCGQTDDGEQPTTVAVYSMPASLARELFDVAFEVAKCEREEGDFVVDLCVDDSIELDFWSNRQIWPLAIEAWNARDSDGSGEAGQTAEQAGPEGRERGPQSGIAQGPSDA